MLVIEVSSRKGGVGTTTTASLLALTLSKKYTNKSVLLVDTSHYGDAFNTLGNPVPANKYEEVEIVWPTSVTQRESSNLHAMHVSSVNELHNMALYVQKFDFIVIDLGVANSPTRERNTYFGDSPFVVSVIDNSYVSIHNEMHSQIIPDAHVVRFNSSRPLNMKDVGIVVSKGERVYDYADNSDEPVAVFANIPIHQFNDNEIVARSIDAGLLPNNVYNKRVNEEWADTLAEEVEKEYAHRLERVAN